MRALNAVTSLMLVMLAFCLMGCTGNNKVVNVRNVTDEMLTCDLQEFSNSMGGKLRSDWRKLGGDGIEVAATEDGTDVVYSFTRQTSDGDSLDSLEFMKTITVNLSSDEVLNVEISETYNSSYKRIGPRKTSYFVANRISDADALDSGLGSFSYIDEDDAIELMNEHGCLQLVEQASTSPIEFSSARISNMTRVLPTRLTIGDTMDKAKLMALQKR